MANDTSSNQRFIMERNHEDKLIITFDNKPDDVATLSIFRSDAILGIKDGGFVVQPKINHVKTIQGIDAIRIYSKLMEGVKQ